MSRPNINPVYLSLESINIIPSRAAPSSISPILITVNPGSEKWKTIIIPTKYNPAKVKNKMSASEPLSINCHQLSSLVHSGHSSLHGKLRQIFFSRSRNGSIPGDPHLSQQRSSFSFLLSRIYVYYSLIALKCVKVGNVNIRMVVLLGR